MRYEPTIPFSPTWYCTEEYQRERWRTVRQAARQQHACAAVCVAVMLLGLWVEAYTMAVLHIEPCSLDAVAAIALFLVWGLHVTLANDTTRRLEAIEQKFIQPRTP